MSTTKVVDVKGLSCPMPIVRTKKAMDTLQTGDVLEIHVTDPGAASDIPAWSASGGHTLLKQEEEDGVRKFWVQKG